jgi:hypothetical protein
MQRCHRHLDRAILMNTWVKRLTIAPEWHASLHNARDSLSIDLELASNGYCVRNER